MEASSAAEKDSLMESSAPEATTATTGPVFSVNEQVLCFHGTCLYEAKILSVNHDETKNEWSYSYKVHYKGWNKKWDEVIQENRILKYTPENLARVKDHNQVIALKQGTEKSASSKAESETSGSSRKSKRRSSVSSNQTGTGVVFSSAKGSKVLQTSTNSKRNKALKSVEPEEGYLAKLEIQIDIPNELKIALIKDWDQVVGHKVLHQVPAQITVESLLLDYAKSCEVPGGLNLAGDFVLGIKDYFNTMLPNSLLYLNEKHQCNELKKQLPKLDDEPRHLHFNFASVYGPVFLLRLFTRIGSCLAISLADKEDLDNILQFTNELMEFILRNREKYFPQAQPEIQVQN